MPSASISSTSRRFSSSEPSHQTTRSGRGRARDLVDPSLDWRHGPSAERADSSRSGRRGTIRGGDPAGRPPPRRRPPSDRGRRGRREPDGAGPAGPRNGGRPGHLRPAAGRRDTLVPGRVHRRFAQLHRGCPSSVASWSCRRTPAGPSPSWGRCSRGSTCPPSRCSPPTRRWTSSPARPAPAWDCRGSAPSPWCRSPTAASASPGPSAPSPAATSPSTTWTRGPAPSPGAGATSSARPRRAPAPASSATPRR